MLETQSSARITTREFWHSISNPTDSTLGKAILMLLVFAESLVCIFWIYTLSGLGEGPCPNALDKPCLGRLRIRRSTRLLSQTHVHMLRGHGLKRCGSGVRNDHGLLPGCSPPVHLQRWWSSAPSSPFVRLLLALPCRPSC